MVTHRERIQKVLNGEQPDRTPVTAWRHFPGHEHTAAALVEIHRDFQAEYDWDLIKLQPSSVHFAEAWGGQYDYGRYGGSHPTLVRPAASTPDDLAAITTRPGDSGPFGTQLQAVRELRRALGDDVPLVQTVFSPLSVVELLFGHLRKGRSDSLLVDGLASHAAMVHKATQHVAATLADYSRRLLDAGADGIFFAVTNLASSGYLTRDEHEQFGRPYDLQVLEAVKGAPLNILHICGMGVYFDDFLDYPVPILSWAATADGNPTVGDAARRTPKVLMTGVGEKTQMLHGSPGAITGAVGDAVKATDGKRLIIAPECSYPPDTPAAHVRALRNAVDGEATVTDS